MKAVDLTDWKWNADLFNKFGKQVSDAGMTFGYHNHSAEFKKFDGQTAFDYLFANTDREAREDRARCGLGHGGRSRIRSRILNKYKDRVIALHVKDVGKRGCRRTRIHRPVALGEGVIDWKTVIGTAKKPTAPRRSSTSRKSRSPGPSSSR